MAVSNTAYAIHAEIDNVATLYKSKLGGPIRTIKDGRKRVPTGTARMAKGGVWRMPWESILEYEAMCLADISCRVRSLLAQPHRLDMRIEGLRRPWSYTPDLLLEVEPSFIEDLEGGIPFSQAALRNSTTLGSRHHEWLVVEVKDDLDDRNDDPRYQNKIELAKEVYGLIGYRFVELRLTPSLRRSDVDLARYIHDIAKVSVAERDYWQAIGSIVRSGGSISLGDLENALGGGPIARRLCLAMHIERRIAIDFSNGIDPYAPVTAHDRLQVVK